MGRNFCWI